MKTPLKILFGLLLSFTLASHAEVIIYKKKITTVATGGGSITKQTVTGWTVIDTEGTNTVDVDVFSKRGRFTVYKRDYDFSRMTAGIGTSYLVASEASTDYYDDGAPYTLSAVIKGREVLLDIFTRDFSAPKTMTFIERFIYELSNGDQVIEESSGRLAFDKANTQDANFAGVNVEEAADALRQFLISKGYTEE